MSLQDAVKQAATGEPIDPSFLEAPTASPEDMNGRYREVFDFFFEAGAPAVRRTLGVSPCSECGGIVLKLESKVPGAVRYDGCCSNCGGNEFHRAGWTDREARDAYRASIGSKEVAP